jgi:hypothetical protein
VDRVKPLKIESVASGGDEEDEFPTSLDPTEDHVECAGIVFDDPLLIDETTVIDRDGVNLRFKDQSNPSGFTLTQLATAGVPDLSKVILTVAGTMVYVGDGDIVLRSV